MFFECIGIHDDPRYKTAQVEVKQSVNTLNGLDHESGTHESVEERIYMLGFFGPFFHIYSQNLHGFNTIILKVLGLISSKYKYEAHRIK